MPRLLLNRRMLLRRQRLELLPKVGRNPSDRDRIRGAPFTNFARSLLALNGR